MLNRLLTILIVALSCMASLAQTKASGEIELSRADGLNGERYHCSSMVVGKKCSVTLYEQANDGGRSVTYSAKFTGKNLKVNWLGDFNDMTSSLKVDCS